MRDMHKQYLCISRITQIEIDYYIYCAVKQPYFRLLYTMKYKYIFKRVHAQSSVSEWLKWCVQTQAEKKRP